MSIPAPADESRILLRVATSRDALMAGAVLQRAGLTSFACADVQALVRALEEGAGAVLVAEEMLAGDAAGLLGAALEAQPPWSDLPVLVLARKGAASRAIDHAMDRLANVTVIERPVRVASLVSTVRTALRARRRQYELRGLLEGLREADQRKTEFLATLAHELRNPLAPLSTTLALLALKRPGPAEARKYYELMGRQVDHMARLVNDLMEVSRITRGKVDLQMSEVQLTAVIHDAIEQSRPLVQGAGHSLTVQFPEEPDQPDHGLMVRGDSVRLTQVFSNLLNNAAKYTPAGGRVRVVLHGEPGEAVVEVSDTGVGIDGGMLDAIFDMFVQVSDTAKAAQGGLGIGLTLVKSLVELHGGHVSASSPGLGQGTTFTVRLPLARHAAALGAVAVNAGAALPLASKTILVVDDNHDAADSLGELLGSMGAAVLVAYSGAEALQLARSRLPQVAILDLGMPGMDGYELAHGLRLLPLGAEVMMIAMTGWGQQADRDRVTAAGFDHHLLKPLVMEELLALV